MVTESLKLVRELSYTAIAAAAAVYVVVKVWRAGAQWRKWEEEMNQEREETLNQWRQWEKDVKEMEEEMRRKRHD